MTIHHATIKKAEKSGIILTEVEDVNGPVAQAHWAKNNVRLEHVDAKIALEAMTLNQTLATEYPGVSVDFDGNWIVNIKGEGFALDVEEDRSPELADVLEAVQAEGFDPEADFEDEGPGGERFSVEHKRRYKEAGHPGRCGDWLDELLQKHWKADDPAFVEKVMADMEANELDPSAKKWVNLPNSDQKGWKGRFRANARQYLERHAALTKGKIVLQDTTFDIPIDWAKKLEKRYPNLIMWFMED